ncbi:MAG TPA: hypothetical protein PLQ35_13095 [bacterium]|jgi:hypothetical protein|nr:hypothetical protein [bacterium]HQL63221.1 hypothetical protein [bacterium]
MVLSLEDFVPELIGDISGTLITIRDYAEPKAVRIIAPCISSLEDNMKRLEQLDSRLASITETQLRAELVTIVRNLVRTFDEMKRSRQVNTAWYEGEPGTGLPPAVIKAKEFLGL